MLVHICQTHDSIANTTAAEYNESLCDNTLYAATSATDAVSNPASMPCDIHKDRRCLGAHGTVMESWCQVCLKDGVAHITLRTTLGRCVVVQSETGNCSGAYYHVMSAILPHTPDNTESGMAGAAVWCRTHARTTLAAPFCVCWCAHW